MDINRFKFTQIVNTAVMLADGEGIMRWANDSYASLTGLHLPMWMGRDTGEISRKGYLKIHGDGGLMYKTVQKTGESVTCNVDFPDADNIITTAMPLQEDGRLDGILYLLSPPSKVQTEALSKEESGILTRKLFPNSPDIIINAPAMQSIYLKAAQAAPFKIPVTITGESGSGKDVLAKFIHSASNRCKNNFVHINCGALPEALFESEMFGYEPGSFTGGARYGKSGLLEMTDGGTLFLDEIGDLPLSLQAKLLTFLSSDEFMKVGGRKPVSADVRIIAATNKDIKAMVSGGIFRKDLYYRLNTVELNIPPLRERVSEIPVFIDFFIGSFNDKYSKNVVFHQDALGMMYSQPWYGNIRELRSVIERIILFSECDVITPDIFETEYQPVAKESALSLKAHMEKYERKLIESTIKSSRTLNEAAAKLQIDLSTLTRKRQKYKI